jgi:predicted nucleotidyltransferase
MTAEQKAALIAWAGKHEAIAAVWLFGSQARGDARPDSDHDIALELMPKHSPADDWAYTQYYFSCSRWKREIADILQNKISLVCYREDMDCRFDPRVLMIWSRD